MQAKICVSCSTSELRAKLAPFTDRSKAVLLLLVIHVISVLCLLCFRACLFIDAL